MSSKKMDAQYTIDSLLPFNPQHLTLEDPHHDAFPGILVVWPVRRLRVRLARVRWGTYAIKVVRESTCLVPVCEIRKFRIKSLPHPLSSRVTGTYITICPIVLQGTRLDTCISLLFSPMRDICETFTPVTNRLFTLSPRH